MSNLILISGKKEAGKNSIANYICGHILQKQGLIKRFGLNDNGKLLVDFDGGKEDEWGNLDLERQDFDFVNWASTTVWPYVKLYSFVRPLKNFCIENLGLSNENCNGTNAQKDEKLDIQWENIPGVITKKKLSEIRKTNPEFKKLSNKKIESLFGLIIQNNDKASGRELMEYIGNWARAIDENAWVRPCLLYYYLDQPDVGIITDGRFPNEIDTVMRKGGLSFRLTRNIHNSQSKIETALDNYPLENYTEVIDNANMGLIQQGEYAIELLYKHGVLTK